MNDDLTYAERVEVVRMANELTHKLAVIARLVLDDDLLNTDERLGLLGEAQESMNEFMGTF